MTRLSHLALSSSPVSHGPNLLAILGVVFFAASLIVTARLLTAGKTRKPRDPWAGGTIDDGTDAIDALTDPNLPAHGYERPEVVYGPEPADALVGAVVGDADWETAMTVPAPPITPQPSGFAEAWIAAFERGENIDPATWSQRMLEGAR